MAVNGPRQPEAATKRIDRLHAWTNSWPVWLRMMLAFGQIPYAWWLLGLAYPDIATHVRVGITATYALYVFRLFFPRSVEDEAEPSGWHGWLARTGPSAVHWNPDPTLDPPPPPPPPPPRHWQPPSERPAGAPYSPPPPPPPSHWPWPAAPVLDPELEREIEEALGPESTLQIVFPGDPRHPDPTSPPLSPEKRRETIEFIRKHYEAQLGPAVPPLVKPKPKPKIFEPGKRIVIRERPPDEPTSAAD